MMGMDSFTQMLAFKFGLHLENCVLRVSSADGTASTEVSVVLATGAPLVTRVGAVLTVSILDRVSGTEPRVQADPAVQAL